MATPAISILYPHDGGTYPAADVAPPRNVKSAYVTVNFGAKYPGGPNALRWGFDARSRPLGNVRFFDETSLQFVYRLPKGAHTFWVKCGEKTSQIEFKIR